MNDEKRAQLEQFAQTTFGSSLEEVGQRALELMRRFAMAERFDRGVRAGLAMTTIQSRVLGIDIRFSPNGRGQTTMDDRDFALFAFLAAVAVDAVRDRPLVPASLLGASAAEEEAETRDAAKVVTPGGE